MPHGSKVRVVYLPDDPEGTAEIGTGVRMWGFPVMAIVVGGLIALFGAAMGK